MQKALLLLFLSISINSNSLTINDEMLTSQPCHMQNRQVNVKGFNSIPVFSPEDDFFYSIKYVFSFLSLLHNLHSLAVFLLIIII